MFDFVTVFHDIVNAIARRRMLHGPKPSVYYRLICTYGSHNVGIVVHRVRFACWATTQKISGLGAEAKSIVT